MSENSKFDVPTFPLPDDSTKFVRNERTTYAVHEITGYRVTRSVWSDSPRNIWAGSPREVCVCRTRVEAEAIAKALAGGAA